MPFQKVNVATVLRTDLTEPRDEARRQTGGCCSQADEKQSRLVQSGRRAQQWRSPNSICVWIDVQCESEELKMPLRSFGLSNGKARAAVEKEKIIGKGVDGRREEIQNPEFGHYKSEMSFWHQL